MEFGLKHAFYKDEVASQRHFQAPMALLREIRSSNVSRVI
jgi:hypothetical protein